MVYYKSFKNCDRINYLGKVIQKTHMCTFVIKLKMKKNHLYIIDGVLYVRYKILRLGPQAFVGPVGSRCQPKVDTLACAGRRPAYMLVDITHRYNFSNNIINSVYIFDQKVAMHPCQPSVSSVAGQTLN